MEYDKNHDMEVINFALNFDSTANPSLKSLPSLDSAYLANQTGMKIQKVRSLLKKIKSSRDVQFEMNIDTSKLQAYRGTLEIKSKHPKYNAELTNQLVQIPFVRAVHELAGDDLSHIITFLVPNEEYLSHWIETYIIKKFADRIDHLKTMITYELNYHFKKEISQSKARLDCFDWHITGLLLGNALITLRELSEKIGLSLAAIHKRIEKLKKIGVFDGYNCYIAWNRLKINNSPSPFICKINVDYSYLSQIHSILKTLNLIRVFRTLDKTDFLLFTSVQNMKEYRELEKKISSIPGVMGIRTYFITQSIMRYQTILDLYDYYSNKRSL